MARITEKDRDLPVVGLTFVFIRGKISLVTGPDRDTSHEANSPPPPYPFPTFLPSFYVVSGQEEGGLEGAWEEWRSRYERLLAGQAPAMEPA